MEQWKQISRYPLNGKKQTVHEFNPFNLVRIFWPDPSRYLGAGTVFDDLTAVTCSHIFEITGKSVKTGETIFIQAPLDREFYSYRVVLAEKSLLGGGGDIVILKPSDASRLTDPVDMFIKPVSNIISGFPFVSFGYPKGMENMGVHANGVIGKPNSVGWHELHTKSGIPIQPGFSGSPLVDSIRGSVFGMIVGNYSDLSAGVSFAIPFELPIFRDYIQIPSNDYCIENMGAQFVFENIYTEAPRIKSSDLAKEMIFKYIKQWILQENDPVERGWLYLAISQIALKKAKIFLTDSEINASEYEADFIHEALKNIEV